MDERLTTATTAAAVREIDADGEAAETVVVTPATPQVAREGGRPDPNWVRGRCPECGDDLVSNMYYIGGQGYLMCWECWGSLGENPQCHYRRVL
jgi:hypothetical protein